MTTSARAGRGGLRRAALLAAAASLLLTPVPSGGATAAEGSPGPGPDRASTEQARDRRGFLDLRQVEPRTAPGAARKALPGGGAARVGALRRALGPGAVVDIDPLTGTPANLMVLSDYLTGPSDARPARVALRYVRGHARQLGLRAADLATLRLRRHDVDPAGTHHLAWTQSVRGVTVFGNGLEAHVARNGRLLAVQGAPVPGLAGLTARATTEPGLTAEQARGRAAGDVGGTVATAGARTSGAAVEWGNGDRAELVWFVTASGPRLGWSTYVQAGGTLSYSHVIDARTGAVLYRRDLVQQDRGDARVYDNYPGAARGGRAKVVNLYDRGWLKRSAPWLRGTSVSAWADLDDDNRVSANETTPVPGTARRAQFRLRHFNRVNPLCSARYVCTWDPGTAFSWRRNKRADVTNAFYLASTFHDYLARRPVGFTARAGNFERTDGDPVLLNALDGANTDAGLPDGSHVDNANMSTPPDGTSPTMQMYLFHTPGATNEEDPFLPTSSSMSAEILYHEYVHGLSNRLVVDAQGNSTLNSIQAGAMGEAWSDYYAFDYLVARRFERDTARPGQLLVGKYVSAGQPFIRTQALDCDPDDATRLCTRLDGTKGGYTYGDFPTVGSAPEVHDSGEIWAQTLWDLRERLGHRVTAMLVTRGMQLSRNDPTFLDMRNAVIQADLAAYGGRHTPVLWRLFAARGMGWYAGATDAGDAFPAEDFHVRPAPERGTSTVFGLVLDALTDQPLAGASVRITGHPQLSAVANANGVYQIPNVPPGRYRKVVMDTAGYEVVTSTVRVEGEATRFDFPSRRDWAALDGGGAVTDFSGPDYTPACGPEYAIDRSQGTGWGSTTGDDDATPTGTVVPKRLVVRLPQAVDIGAGTGVASAFKLDPSATCGDAGSASTGDLTIEVAANAGGPWTTVVDLSGEDEWLPRYQFSELSADQAVPGVRFVRLTLRGPQVPDFATTCPDGPFTGCQFMDFTELEVFGPPAG